MKAHKLIKKSALSSLTNLVNSIPHRDVLLVSSQNIKWTAKELDTYTTAFAKHLIELGFKHGNKIYIWSDINHTAETICSSLGALKAGISIENNCSEQLEEIKQSMEKSDIILFSPFNTFNGQTRLEILSKWNFSNKHFIQVSHKSIDGMIKFKQAFNYSEGFNSSINLPDLDESSIAYSSSLSGEITHGDINNISDNHSKAKKSYINTLNSAPCFYPSSMILGLFSQINNQNYSVFPGTYSMKEILKQIKMQNISSFICEASLLDMKLPEDKYKEIAEKSSSLESLIVLSESGLSDNHHKFIDKCFRNVNVEVFHPDKITKI